MIIGEQLNLFNNYSEVDEISIEDLNAAADKFDQIVNEQIISKLRKSAESCLSKAEKINTEVSGNWTNRRQSFADNASRKKDNLIKDATALNRLADLWEINECPEILKFVRTIGDFDAYYPRDIEADDGWFKDEHPKLLAKAKRLGLKSQSDNKPFKDALLELRQIRLTPEEEKKRLINQKLIEIRKSKIPGFFPTPDELIDEMIELADLSGNESILEPSAGIGSICDRLRERGHTGTINACEVVFSLYEILRLKGYVCSNEDILSDKKVDGKLWDRIIMNPPFENKQDIDHVMHCYNTFLKEGGILVSIMSAGVNNNTDKKSIDFREFVSNNGNIFEAGQRFNKSNAFRNTGVSTIIVVLTK